MANSDHHHTNNKPNSETRGGGGGGGGGEGVRSNQHHPNGTGSPNTTTNSSSNMFRNAWRAYQRAPMHWKILLGGQAVITIGAFVYRINLMMQMNGNNDNGASFRSALQQHRDGSAELVVAVDVDKNPPVVSPSTR